MANKKIKGITIEIGGDTSKLGEAISDSEKKTASLKKELGGVNKLLKFDTGNVELLSQKQDLLTSSVEATKEKLDVLREAQAQVQEQFEKGDIGAEQYREFQRELVRTEQDLANFERALDQTNESLGRAKGVIVDTTTPLQDLNKEIKTQESELKLLNEQYQNVALSQGKNSEEAQALADKIQELNKDLKKNKEALEDSKYQAEDLGEELEDAGDSAEDAGDGFTIMRGALADLVSSAIQGAISAVGDLIGSLMELTEATEEYRLMQAKVEGSAQTFGYSMDFVSEKYKQFYSYLADDQMATNAITNLLGLGTSTESLTALAEGAIGVWSAYGDSIPIEGLTEALNETAQVGKVTGSLADALNWAGISEDAFNEKLEALSTTQERADLIAQTLNETYGDSKKKFDELTGGIIEANEAEAELKETQAELGEALEPVHTAMTNLKNQALEAITPLVMTLSDAFADLLVYLNEHPQVLTVVGALVAGLASAFTVLATALGIQALINGVTKAFTALNVTMLANPAVLIVAGITALVVALLTLWTTNEDFRNFVIQAWESIKNAVQVVVDALILFFTVTIPEAWNSFTAYLSTFATNVTTTFSNMWNSVILFFTETIPAWIQSVIEWFEQLPYNLGRIVGEILAFIAEWALDLYKFYTETVPEFIEKVLEWFGSLPSKIWEAIVDAIKRLSEWGTQMYNTGVTSATNTVNQVTQWFSQLPSKIWNAIIGAVQKLVEWGSEMATQAVTSAQEIMDSIVSTLEELPEKVFDIGVNLIEGLWDGVISMSDWLWGMISDFCSGIIDSFTENFEIFSPSRKMKREVGKQLPAGIGVGIEENKDLALDPIDDLMADMDSSFNGLDIERHISNNMTVDNLGANMSGAYNALLSKMTNLINIIDVYLPEIAQKVDRPIVLDDGTLVNKIDAGMGDLSIIKQRGG